jgi:hypothetical protein
MTEVRNFITPLARAGKGCKEIKLLADAAYGDMAMSKSQINRIIKVVKEGKNTADQRHSSAKKTKWTGNVLASISTAIEKDRRITVRELAAMHGLPIGTVHAILKEDLGLVKKSACAVRSPSCCLQSRRRRGWIRAATSWRFFGGTH